MGGSWAPLHVLLTYNSICLRWGADPSMMLLVPHRGAAANVSDRLWLGPLSTLFAKDIFTSTRGRATA